MEHLLNVHKQVCKQVVLHYIKSKSIKNHFYWYLSNTGTQVVLILYYSTTTWQLT